MKYKTEEERIGFGICPKCEGDLVKAEYTGGPLGDDHSVCEDCGWEDLGY